MPTQVVSASVLARPVHPILPNRRERAKVEMGQGPSSASDSWARAWVLRPILAPGANGATLSSEVTTNRSRWGVQVTRSHWFDFILSWGYPTTNIDGCPDAL